MKYWDYIEVLKPRETSLLVFISLCTAIVAVQGFPPLGTLLLTLAVVTLGSGGANGITNYMDRGVDARMKRTNHRCLASKRIDPPEKALVYILVLIVIALVLAWFLHPLCFIAGLIGTLAAVIKRKTVLCPVMGSIASCGPILIAWFAFNQQFHLTLLLLCLLIWIWVPLHVWSVMLANPDDYRGAGVNYFPLSRKTKEVVIVLPVLALLLFVASIAIYFSDHWSVLYLIVASFLGVLVIIASSRLYYSRTLKDAWKIYKLSAFPYLGIIFLTMCLDSLLF